MMPDKDLQQYFPAYGDRLAVRRFANNEGTQSRKLTLLKTLQNKIKLKSKEKQSTHSSSDEDSRLPKKKPKCGNEKTTRQVEMGWICSLDGGRYIQVRTKNGGGTRKFSIPKTSTKQDLIAKGLELFFPGNVSSKGPIEMFSINLMDFRCAVIEENETVEAMFTKTKFSNSKVRVYLATKEKVSTTTSDARCNDETDQSALSNEKETINNDAFTTCDTEYDANRLEDTNRNACEKAHREFTDTEELISILSSNQSETLNVVNVDKSNEITVEDRIDTNLDPGVLFVNSDTGISQFYMQYFPEDDEVPMAIAAPNNTENTDEFTVLHIHRANVFEDILEAFMNLKTTSPAIKIRVIGTNGEEEMGEDAGGVFRDILSEFWSHFMDSCTEGAYSKVPCIRHDFNSQKWQAVALILYKGFKETNYFPIELADVFMEMSIFGEKYSDLIDTFLDFVNNDDKLILQRALTNYDEVDENDLYEVLSYLQCKTRVTSQNISTVLGELAHKELIQKGMFIINYWNVVLQGLMRKDELSNIYSSRKINSKNVLALLISPDLKGNLSADKDRIFNYLRKFVRESSPILLRKFLRFCTGADVIVGQKITVLFNDNRGLARCPRAQTCGCSLHLPITYDDFPIFRSEFHSVLNKTDWSLDLI